MQIFQFRAGGRTLLDQPFARLQPEGVGKISEVQFVDGQTFMVLGVSFNIVLHLCNAQLVQQGVARRYDLLLMNVNVDGNDLENARFQ